MRKLILLSCLVVCCYSAPTSHQQSSNEHKEPSVLLNRPSPINPDIPSDPKPEEKITMITDPKVIMKHKREIGADPYEHISRFAPTVVPEKQAEKEHTPESQEHHSTESDTTHHRQRREEASHILEARKPAKAPAETPKPPARKTPVKNENPKQKRHHNVPATVPATPTRDLPKTRQRRQVDPHLIGASTVGFAPQIYTEDEEKKTQESDPKNEGTNQDQPAMATQQTEADVQAENANEHKGDQTKRDIPVPLVPKYHHPEESPKSGDTVGEAQPTNSHKVDEHHQSSDGHTRDKSSDSRESDEDSKEKKPAVPVHNNPWIQPATHAQGVNNYYQHISTQPHLLGAPATESVVPLVEADHHQNHQYHQFIQPIAHTQSASNNLPQISTQHLPVEGSNSGLLGHSRPLAQSEVAHEAPAVPHNTSVTESEHKPLTDPLEDIKHTKIIAYEPQHNDDHLAIKHPVPVAELFSRPKE